MKFVKIYIVLIIISLSINTQVNSQVTSEYIENVKNQLIKLDDILDGRFPGFTRDGIYTYEHRVNWLTGFTGGELWNLYDLTNDIELKERALKHADFLLDYASIDYTHDMGFIFFPTVVEAYKRTGLIKYRDAALRAAEMLVKRFNSKGNFIRSWGTLGTPNNAGLLIIDTMMNLELLFWASQETGDTRFYDIAYKHAITCMNTSVRSNYSSYHAVEFDPNSGSLLKRYTVQGASDESTWARGQAWGIYGFASAFKYTGDNRFLVTSQKMADVFLNKLPADFVPHWDLDLVGDDIIRDASAGAVAASGMYILSNLSKTKDDYQKYFSEANKISESIIKNYSFLNSNRETEEGLLIRTVYFFNKGKGVNESFPCGDFYYTEILKKYINSKKNEIGDIKGLREKILLNENWFYLEDNIQKIENLNRTIKSWEKINLPHSWNTFDAVDAQPGYRRDASWYEKEIYFSSIDKNKLYKLYFEGVNISSEVFVNDEKVGSHIGGYVGFEIDITDNLKVGTNKISVRADNSINVDIIPSQLADFFIYGGISRDVWLKVVPKTNITKIKVLTPTVSKNSAETKIELEFVSDKNTEIDIIVDLFDHNDKLIQNKRESIIAKNGLNKTEIELESVKNPILWSIDNPNLYTVKVSLSNENKIIDETSDRIGYRWFEFEKNGPFYLNGERLLLRGTHRHEDHAGSANALTNSQHRKDIEQIKGMGANFIRLAHYPQDPEIYKACDELGILVWDELPWCRGGVGNNVWKENTVRLFKEMINQNYNHPSIIIWSVGNEVYWLPERENGDNIDSLRNFTKTLVNIAHELDPGRLTSLRKFYEGSDIVDVFSPSIWAGWYSGVYKSYEVAIEDAQNKYPKFFHAEYGGSSHLGRHSENPITGEGYLNPNDWSENVNQVKVQNIANIGDWSENYIVDLFDWHLNVTENSETITGNAQWAFKDFGTPLRPENDIPYINQKGLVDRAGNPKDAYYVFKSYWNNKDKFTYIESHTWTERSGVKGNKKEVCVFSNCSEVELFFNGISLGKKKKDLSKYPASGFSWEVEFKEGKNFLESIGYEKEEKIAKDQLNISYTFENNGSPEKINLSAERLSNGNYIVTAIAVDQDGRRCLDYNERVYFSAEGNGKLIENFGTPAQSSIIEMANGKAQIEFHPIPLEKTTIEILNQNMKGNYLVIDGIEN